MSKPFVFLKVKYTLTDTGKVIMKLESDIFKRERVKLKKLHKKYINGEIPYKDIEAQYKSWRGTVTRKSLVKRDCGKNAKPVFHNKKSVENMDKLFNELFIENFAKGETTNERKNERKTR